MEIKLLEGPMGLEASLLGLGLNFFLTSGYDRWTDVPAEEQDRIRKVACRLAPKGGSEAKWLRAVYYTWNIREAGSRTEIFCYCLIRDDVDEARHRLEFLRKLGVTPFAQPYRDFEGKTKPTPEQKDLARWANLHRFFKAMPWEVFKKTLGGRSGRMEVNGG